jgi:hypothetical protein
MACKGEANTKGAYLVAMIGGGGWTTTFVIGGEVTDEEEEVGLGDVEWIIWCLMEVVIIVREESSIYCWKWAWCNSWSRFANRSSNLVNSWRKHWSNSVLGEIISGVLGCRMFWSRIVSLTKLLDLVLKRICSKDMSNSRSWMATSFYGRELDLWRGLWLLEPSTMFFFLSNFSGSSNVVTCFGSGWDLV